MDIVEAWHAAVNASDAERAAPLSHPEVEVVGPQGVATGRAVVREWVGHAGIRLEPRRWFRRDDRVVVEQRARWRDAATGEAGDPLTVATVFRLRDGLIQRIARRDTLQDALVEAGLDKSTEVERNPAPGGTTGTTDRIGA
jgi:hypothetical protein